MSRKAACVGGFLLATTVVLRRALVVVTVEGHSMEPTLPAGSRVLVRRCGPAGLRRGAVVVLAPPAEARAARRGPRPPDPTPRRLIKRVAALPGDAVPVAVRATSTPAGEVPAGRLVALGDNASRSLDSRQLGLFHTDDVVGVVVRRLEAAPVAHVGHRRRLVVGP
ncbi:S26 family signal peptidase [Jatrophihabitans sp. YIM 134969]